MSGGHWDYRERELDVMIEQLPNIIQFVQDCLKDADLAISADISEEEAKTRLLVNTKHLGDLLYGR